jgi:hypothetical protein
LSAVVTGGMSCVPKTQLGTLFQFYSPLQT